MSRFLFFPSAIGVVLVSYVLSGCGQGATINSAGTGGGGEAIRVSLTPPARVTDRPTNLNGRVLILMYHNFGPEENRYTRSYDHFREDLDRMYQMGFRPVTMSDYLQNEMPLPHGASPVVITMDDTSTSQFQLLPNGDPDPNSAVGIWMAFAAAHPDFPVRGTFYVLPGVMWGQRELRDKKVEMLRARGSELASHTWDHPSLRHLSDRKVKEEISKSLDFLHKYGFDHPSFAYPYGIYPSNMDVLDGFWMNDRSYTLTGAVTCDTNLAHVPTDPDFKPFKIPRVEAVEGDMGIDWWLDKIAKGKRQVFVAP